MESYIWIRFGGVWDPHAGAIEVAKEKATIIMHIYSKIFVVD